MLGRPAATSRQAREGSLQRAPLTNEGILAAISRKNRQCDQSGGSPASIKKDKGKPDKEVTIEGGSKKS